MSIDRAFDAYLDERHLVRLAEVVPDDPCQVFVGQADTRLAEAEDLVRQALLMGKE